MRVKVLYFGLVRSKVGKKEEEYDVEDGSSLSDLLSELAKAYGKKLRSLFSLEKESQLDPTFIVTVNGHIADPAHGAEVKLEEGDTIALMTLISGG
jgi:MoaD family protein